MVIIDGRLHVFGVLIAGLLATSLTSSGCSRTHYRTQADREVEHLVLQKATNSEWLRNGFSVEMDPRSRYYDEHDRDFPPMPSDDPASHEFMRHLDDHKGYKHWDKYGQIEEGELESSCWKEYLDDYMEVTEEGTVKLTLENAIHLGLIHSPTYQQQLETLYLSALDVSTERFRFDVQFFGGNDTTYQHLGSERFGGESNTLTANPNTLLSRRFATAGELLVGLANTTVWEFFGPNTGVTTSLLNFSLVQPLLRSGGRAVALEQLTIAERGLLANVRAFHNYRQGFYTRVAIDDLGVTGPQRRGGFFGGTGLSGFTGQGGSGFGGVGQGLGRGGFGGGDGGGGAGGGGTLGAGGGAGNVGGFIGLVQSAQQLRNRRDNLNLQHRTLALFEANQEAGLIGLDQVLQFRQSIETERILVLQDQNSLQSSIETFLTFRLGLPPNLPVEFDDTLIKQFQFIDPETSGLENDIAEFIKEFGSRQDSTIEDVQQAFDRVTQLRQRLIGQLEVVHNDLNLLESRSEQRQQAMDPDKLKQFGEDKQKLTEDLRELSARIETSAETFEQLKSGLKPETLEQSIAGLIVFNTDLVNLVGELSLIQVRARLESVLLETIELSPEDAICIARGNRLDWMNNRAALVDTWRLIEFNANALKSDLTVRFSGDMGTLGGDNPVKFRDETGTLRASVEFDAPFTRLVERNNFRQQLISYQQARRQLIGFEDNVYRSLRATLRTLDYLRQNLDGQRSAVSIAVARVDLARLDLNKPVPPAQPGQPPAQLSENLTRVLIETLEALRDAQNNVMSVWLNYYAGRMTLMRDLGIMRVDEDGLWIDESLEDALRASRQDCPLPPAAPDGWLEDEVPLQQPDGDGNLNLPPLPKPSALRKRQDKWLLPRIRSEAGPVLKPVPTSSKSAWHAATPKSQRR